MHSHFSDFNDNAETWSYVTVDNGACVTTKLRQNLKVTTFFSAFLAVCYQWQWCIGWEKQQKVPFYLFMSLQSSFWEFKTWRSLVEVNLKWDNQLQKCLRHCTVFWHKWPVHDLVLVIPPPPLIKVASNTRPYSKLGGTTLNGREEGGQYYISQTCHQERLGLSQYFCNWS